MLSFLEAWYKNQSSSKVHVILQRVSILKQILINDEEKLTAVIAIQRFIDRYQKIDDAGTVVNVFTTVCFT